MIEDTHDKWLDQEEEYMQEQGEFYHKHNKYLQYIATICAQAPRTTQGLLIGLWYATFSIRYFVVGILDNRIIERRSWLIYEGMKGFLILVSLVLFSCGSRHYCYRQRDEIVNVQGMIEDTHDKWLDQEEEYMQEQGEFYRNITSTYNTLPQ